MATLSITPGVLDISAQQGKTWVISITVRDSNNALINFTGYTARWQVRAKPSSPAVLDLSTGSGITLNSSGVITITASAALTAAVNASSYLHEIELTEPAGTIPPFLAGRLLVTAEVVK